MSVQGGSVFNFVSKILNDDVECVQVACFEGNDKLFVRLTAFAFFYVIMTSQDVDICIIKLQFALPHRHKVEIVRIVEVELDEEESNFPLVLVRKEVKLLMLVIIQDLSDKFHLEQIVKIHFLTRVCIDPISVNDRCDDIVPLVK